MTTRQRLKKSVTNKGRRVCRNPSLHPCLPDLFCLSMNSLKSNLVAIVEVWDRLQKVGSKETRIRCKLGHFMASFGLLLRHKQPQSCMRSDENGILATLFDSQAGVSFNVLFIT